MCEEQKIYTQQIVSFPMHFNETNELYKYIVHLFHIL